MLQLDKDHIQHSSLGYAVVNKKIELTKEEIEKIAKELHPFNVDIPIQAPEVVGIKDCKEFPYLQPGFKTYDKMMRSFAKEFAGHEMDLLEGLLESFELNGIPSAPAKTQIKVVAGWAKYDFEGNFIGEVEAPTEEILVFDVETFVQGGNFPIIGTATAATNSYIWIAREFIEDNLSEKDWDQRKLIPLPNTKVIVGHNIGFDLCRVKEAYALPIKITAIDTLSMHVVTNGLCSAQRYVASLQYKDKEKLTAKEWAILRNPPKWADAGTTNSLVAVYNFHVAKNDFFEEVEPLEEADKEIRGIFVTTSTMSEFANMGLFQLDLLHYASKDTYYTAKIFEKLYPKYKRAKPHPVALAGHLALLKSRVPVAQNWVEWTQDVENLLVEYQNKVSNIIKEESHILYEQWLNNEDFNPNEDFFHKQLSWKIVKKKRKKGDKPSILVEKLLAYRENPTSHPLPPQFLEIIDWNDEKASKRFLKSCHNYEYMPAWYASIYLKPEATITTKTELCHLLMRLHWKGLPLYKDKNKGWGTFINGEFTKVPHKESVGENVGNMLAKSFIDDIKLGNLTGEHPKVQEVFDVAIRTSFWISTRTRVLERFVMWTKAPNGSPMLMMCPQPIVHGTTTGRSTENLLLVMSNIKYDKIGSELRSKVQAPNGYKFVSADFDAQELQLSSLWADLHNGGILGSTATTYQTVAGTKETFSDPHSAVAYELFLKPKGYKFIDGEWWIEEKG